LDLTQNRNRQIGEKTTGPRGLEILVDWAIGKSQIQNLVLELIVERIVGLRALFEDISFAHIYRNFNHKAYQLSKEALRLEEGVLNVQEYRDSIPLVVEVLTLF
jgi:hypothetical protein